MSLPAFLVGVTRRLAGQAFHSNLFLRRKISKKGFPLQSLTQLIYDLGFTINDF
ncbi:MAG: hypothetical protein Q7U21_08935 [Lutibacter sp.]|nr:hypothetical protein [Lutibacter sp.]